MHSRSAAFPPREAAPKSTRRLLLAGAVLLGLFVVGTAAADAIFTVTLSNGTNFQTRYRPVVADWDDSIALIRTDQGNWIAIPKDEIADVTSRAEVSGFGYQLDTTTLFLGWSPNDIIDDGDGDGDGDGEEGGGGGTEEARPYYEDDSLYDAPADTGGGAYTLDQFVDVPTEGESIGAVEIGPTVNPGGDG